MKKHTDKSLQQLDNSSPYQIARKLLLMVAELHQMGYQKLRIAPELAPSGCYWRCKFVPVSMISTDHGAICDVSGKLAPRYSSGQKDDYFDWGDTAGDSPTELALKFIARFPRIVEASRGNDNEYVGWYTEMLRVTEPEGIIYAIGDFGMPRDKISSINMDGVFVPMPPLPLVKG